MNAPWTVPLNPAEHAVIEYFLFFAGLALVVGLVRSIMTRGEVGVRYRSASVARVALMSAATLTYLVILINFDRGYSLHNGLWMPNGDAIGTFSPRYVEWSITVPLLVVELLAVTTLFGETLRRVRTVTAALAFLMIFSGFLGAIVLGAGTDPVQIVFWGLVSCIFWVTCTIILIRSVRASMPALTTESYRVLVRATAILLGGWVVYPVLYTLQLFGSGGAWVTIVQVTLCVADVAVKLGFAGLVHRVAKLRTAEDVRTGEDMHPEAIWISSEKQSDAGAPREVYLADDQLVHRRRARPAESTAIASPEEPQTSEYD